MSDTFKWDWTPKVSVGGLEFEKPLILKDLPFKMRQLEKNEYDDEEKSQYILKGQSVRIDLYDDIFSSAELSKELILNGTNLIGLKLDELVQLLADLGHDCETEDHGYEMQIDCDDLEALFWAEDGIIMAGSVSGVSGSEVNE